MISLGRTRAELLAEIDAPSLPGDPLSDLTDLHAASEDAYVRVCGRARDELFPLLKIALSERFAAAPRLQVIRDLLLPLRNILGNAYKHGNGCDPAKVISVEIVLTAKGALIAVTDEGSGFDVALTFRRFQGQESYFANHGSDSATCTVRFPWSATKTAAAPLLSATVWTFAGTPIKSLLFPAGSVEMVGVKRVDNRPRRRRSAISRKSGSRLQSQNSGDAFKNTRSAQPLSSCPVRRDEDLNFVRVFGQAYQRKDLGQVSIVSLRFPPPRTLPFPLIPATPPRRSFLTSSAHETNGLPFQ